jgi:hypothetical protein
VEQEALNKITTALEAGARACAPACAVFAQTASGTLTDVSGSHQ